MVSSQTTDPLWAWGENADRPRVLHSMIRVQDVDASLRFYCEGLGMTLLDRYDFEQARFSILFLSYAGYRDGPAAIELTYNWDQAEPYSHGSGYGHIAIGVPDVAAMWERLPAFGGTKGTAPKALVKDAPLLAFVKDPDGYAIELIQTRRTMEVDVTDATATVDPSLLEGLREIVGERGLLLGDDLRMRSCDPFRHLPPLGPALVRPASTGELARVLAFCHARGQRVVTHGGRTGVSGGALAGLDEVVISLERMARILEIDPVGMTATVEAGATLESVHQAAAEAGLLYPVDIGAKGSATTGGTIATNAGGNRVIRWGMTRQNVLGLEAVLADGTVVGAMNRYLKNNTGYDIKQAFIGSEGTIGIVTQAVLKLVALPQTQCVAFASLPDFASVLELLARARRMQQLSAFEVMWRDYYELVAKSDPKRRPVAPDQPFYVLLEAMGFDEVADDATFVALLEGAFTDGLIVDAVTASSVEQADELWRVRESSDIMVREMGPFVPFDISVDIRRADDFARAVRNALHDRFETYKMVTLGHLGDGNLHIGVHIGPDTPARADDIENCVYRVVREYDGALTAEHGVGQSKRAFLAEHLTAGALETMRRLRDALDPDRILNRDVLFRPEVAVQS